MKLDLKQLAARFHSGGSYKKNDGQNLRSKKKRASYNYDYARQKQIEQNYQCIAAARDEIHRHNQAVR